MFARRRQELVPRVLVLAEDFLAGDALPLRRSVVQRIPARLSRTRSCLRLQRIVADLAGAEARRCWSSSSAMSGSHSRQHGREQRYGSQRLRQQSARIREAPWEEISGVADRVRPDPATGPSGRLSAHGCGKPRAVPAAQIVKLAEHSDHRGRDRGDGADAGDRIAAEEGTRSAAGC